MNLITVILSIYFLALNMVPCSDAGAVEVDTQITTVSVNDGDHNHDNADDLCSPFCQCHCCHSHTIGFGLVVFEPIQPLIPNENFVHFDSLGKDISHSLLQPPRA